VRSRLSRHEHLFSRREMMRPWVMIRRMLGLRALIREIADVLSG
jgi:hypothetical protein